MKRLIAIILAGFVAVSPTLATAGSSEASEPILPVHEVAAFSGPVHKDLPARGAQVAIVARMGRDPRTLPEGIKYTHVAYWVYSEITEADGSKSCGYRAYNLYHLADDQTQSHLVQDTPADFFAGAQRLDAGIIIPDPRLQSKLRRSQAPPTAICTMRITLRWPTPRTSGLRTAPSTPTM